MRAWFEALEARERTLVLVGGAALALALLWSLIWLPLDRGHKALTDSVATWESALAELRPLSNRAAADTDAPPAPGGGNSNQTPVVIVDLTLRNRGLDRSLRRSQPTTSNGIRVEFENVAFDDLILWLGDLSSQYAMEVQAGNMSTAAREAPGRINASLTLERNL